MIFFFILVLFIKEFAAYGIVLDLWDFIPSVCLVSSVGLFSIPNYNWADLHIMSKEKLVEAVRVTFFTN